jgi:hypothetical protein
MDVPAPTIPAGPHRITVPVNLVMVRDDRGQVVTTHATFRSYLKLRIYATTLSRSAPVTVLTGFILPLLSGMIALSSVSLIPSTSAAFKFFISTFCIFAIAAFGAPSAPWQALQALLNALPGFRVGRHSQGCRYTK